MAFSVKVLADSLAPCGKRLTTFECSYPRFIHSEILTHRLLSRNSASSRAIPVTRLIDRVLEDPVIPLYIGANQKGMQAGSELNEVDRQSAIDAWLEARDEAVGAARSLVALNVHKSIPNRLLEPWMWITVIISATEWDNFFGLRRHKDAEPHFQYLANMMWEAREASKPEQLGAGEWHLPLISHEDRWAAFTLVTGREVPEDLLQNTRPHPLAGTVPLSEKWAAKYDEIWKGIDDSTEKFIHTRILDILKKVSVGRVARVSYLTHDGRRDLSEDIGLHDRLVAGSPLHASPAEHIAMALPEAKRIGNFIGWLQLRKSLPNEHIGGPMP